MKADVRESPLPIDLDESLQNSESERRVTFEEEKDKKSVIDEISANSKVRITNF